MADTYIDTGSEAAYASRMPNINNDADIHEAIQAYHYGDPVLSTASSFSFSWTDPSVGILGKLLYLNDAKIARSIITAKGQLLTGTATSTPSVLAPSTNGYVLKLNSSTATGLEWYNLDTTHLALSAGSLQTVTSDVSIAGKLTTKAPISSKAYFNLTPGTAPVSGLANGDLWLTADGIYARIAGDTYPLAVVADGPGGLNGSNVTSGIVAGQYGGTGVSNTNKTITLGGNLTLSGAYSLTLTSTGNTNVTFPTSGTLVALDTTTVQTGNKTFSGQLIVDSSSNATLNLSGAATGNSSNIYLQTGGENRWRIAKDTSAESGANAGSNFKIIAYDDSEVLLSTPVTITRSTGAVEFGSQVTLPTLIGTDATDSSSSTTGAFKTAGGMGVAKKLYVGTDLNVAGNAIITTQASTDNSTNAASTAFVANRFSSHLGVGAGDWDSAVGPSGFYPYLKHGVTDANGPGGGYQHLLNVNYAQSNGSGNLTQLALAYSVTSTDTLSIRGRYNGTWTSWQKMATKSYVDQSMPVGAIIAYGSATPPAGWLVCNGQSTAGYSDLAAVVGANVPDLRSKFVKGAGENAQGATGGTKTITLPQHTHTATSTHNISASNSVGGVPSNLGNHTHTIYVDFPYWKVPQWTSGEFYDAYLYRLNYSAYAYVSDTNLAHGHGAPSVSTSISGGVSTSLTNSGTAGATMEPVFYALTYIIKAV